MILAKATPFSSIVIKLFNIFIVDCSITFVMQSCDLGLQGEAPC
jgi:hypothetical protein